MHLQGKVALVTGAGRGIGRAVALALAGAGAAVALMARSPAELASVAAEIGRHTLPMPAEISRHALPVQADVSDAAAVEQAIAQIGRELGRIDILVNGAGVAPSLKIQDTADDLWKRTLAVNLSGPFYLCRAVLPAMCANGWGRIINIASTAARTGYRYNAAYAASKHGLMGLTRALALEVAHQGVTVNAVCPGFTDTDIVTRAVENLAHKTGRTAADARRALEAMSPQARLMTPEEVAATVLFLTTEAARGINGQGIVLDGGGVQA